MVVGERHSGNDVLCPLFDCACGSLNFGNMLFGSGGVHNNIFHQFSYSPVKLHFCEESLYNYATSEIYFHNPFLIFNQLLRRKGWLVCV